MEYEKIVELIHEINKSNISEFQLQKGEFQVKVKKDQAAGIPLQVEKEKVAEKSGIPSKNQGQKKNIIESSVVGIFHFNCEDNNDIKIGKTVEKGKTLGTIEAMKLMNDVVAPWTGVLSEILVKDGELVEYGQPLFVVEG